MKFFSGLLFLFATYLPHPAHETFVAEIKPHLVKVYVFDYRAKP